METFVTLKAIAAPLLLPNIDTDVIIPSREMKGVGKSGLGAGAFANWRYSDPASRTENPEFVLNREPYRAAKILIAGANFGCGSSREHAVWALREFGIRAVVAPSFGAIFHGNCTRNGILPVVVSELVVKSLADKIAADPAKNVVEIDLARQTVGVAGDEPTIFTIAAADKAMLLEGLDALDLALRRAPEIEAFETRDRRDRPWAHAAGSSPLA